MSDLKRNPACGVKAFVLLLILACLLIIRAWPELSSNTRVMMPMETPMAAGLDHTATSDRAQSPHACFDSALRCISMMGGVCPLALVNCVPAYAASLAVPQLQFPVHLATSIWSSLWPSVPKQPPRR